MSLDVKVFILQNKFKICNVLYLERGRVYVFGNNEWGQLGLGHTKATNKPSFIKGNFM